MMMYYILLYLVKFSYFFNQTTLTKWSKGYRCSGVVGNDIAKMLHEAIVRKFGEVCFYFCYKK